MPVAPRLRPAVTLLNKIRIKTWRSISFLQSLSHNSYVFKEKNLLRMRSINCLDSISGSKRRGASRGTIIRRSAKSHNSRINAIELKENSQSISEDSDSKAAIQTCCQCKYSHLWKPCREITGLQCLLKVKEDLISKVLISKYLINCQDPWSTCSQRYDCDLQKK